MNPIKTAMRQFTERCRAERALQRRGFSLPLDWVEAFASDDGATIIVHGEVGGVPVGCHIDMPGAAADEPAVRQFIEHALAEAGDSADAGFRPGAVRLAVDNTMSAVA